MPKSRRTHKRIPKTKKVQITPSASTAVPQPSVAQTGKPIAAAKPAPGASAAALVHQNPFVGAELRAIGIVTGIVIVILVVLYFIVG